MKFSLVFENSGDSIPFTVIANEELFEFFVDKSNASSNNLFSNNKLLADKIDQQITHLHWAISKTNEVLYSLIGKSFEQQNILDNYLDQDFLNKTHADWVFSQLDIVDIDKMRFSNDHTVASIGNKLHELYPDEIRQIKTAPAMEKLGYIYPYEEVNLGVHGLELLFNKRNLEYSSVNKWDVFENPFRNNMISNNDIVNFSFGYTYVGRQYYNKFEQFDNDLVYKDHYNYETLEYSFQLNLANPQTIPYSKEFVAWTKKTGAELITNQLPIANTDNLTKNLFEYRKILYRNSRDNNQATIILH
jgi:hypothetical protein